MIDQVLAAKIRAARKETTSRQCSDCGHKHPTDRVHCLVCGLATRFPCERDDCPRRVR